MIPSDQNQRMFVCFVCGFAVKEFNDWKKHIFEKHEESREYLVCPVKYCGCPVRDMRTHFRTKHPSCKLPHNCQMRPTVMYDVRNPRKPRKLPTFKEGYLESKKNHGKVMHYRSSYEQKVYESLELIGEVLSYRVEPFSIPYYFKGQQKQYFPDLLVEFNNGAVEVWEVKPQNQCKNKQNIAKWEAAKHYCQLRGWKFEVYTEKRIEQLKQKTK